MNLESLHAVRSTYLILILDKTTEFDYNKQLFRWAITEYRCTQ